MLVISVSRSSEKPMLAMVSKLRRLLRNVLRITKLPKVIRFGLAYVPQAFHNFDARCVVGRDNGTQKSHQRRH